MEEMLGRWVLMIAGTSVVCSVAMALTPDGSVKKILIFICGLLMIAVILKPIVSFNYKFSGSFITNEEAEAKRRIADIEKANGKLTRSIIERQCGAYILDKAEELGAENMEVQVTAKWSDDGYWYPASAKINGEVTDSQKLELAWYIEANLGIQTEDQSWNV